MLLIVFLVLAVVLQFSLFVETAELTHPTTSAQFGTLYKTVKYHDQKSMLYAVTFCVRRLFFVLSMQIQVFSCQLALILALQIAQFYYLLKQKPFVES